MQPSEILRDAESILDDTIQLRRRIHRHPELGLTLPRTQGAVLDALDGLDLDVRTGLRRADSGLSRDRERCRLRGLRARHRARAARAGGGACHEPSDHGERGLLVRAPACGRRHREPEHAPRRWSRVPESLAPDARERVGAGRGDRDARRRGAAVPREGKGRDDARLTERAVAYFSAVQIAAAHATRLGVWGAMSVSRPSYTPPDPPAIGCGPR